MRKIKEVLRLRFGLNLGQDQIARSCSIGQATVHRYLERAAEIGLGWPLPEDCDDQRLNELLFPTRPVWPPIPQRPGVDFTQIHAQLQSHKHVTLRLVWEEYREVHPDGYGYSRFCDLYQHWARNQDVVLRQEHRAGEKTFVDWAGDSVPIYDRKTGEAMPASIFVAVLGASSYTFARAALGQGLANWIDCHVRAFEFFQGSAKLLVPDNPRTGVTRACRYEPDLNRTYHEMAQHYSIAVLPARPRKPRDKAKVENAVGVVERWILAALRHRKFFAVAELNEAIEELLDRLNHRSFRKREGTGASLFESLDRPALQPLPAQRYVMAEWKTVRANIDYHIEIDRHYYSVPYQLAGQQMEARYTATSIELFHNGKRVASHARSSAAYRHTTIHEHMPKSHQAHLEWTPSRLIHWGESVGSATAEVIRNILASRPHPEMGYRACLGILRLAKTYSNERLEAASQRALQLQACSYSSLRSILKRSLDRQTTLDLDSGKSGPRHENVRGPDYYDPPTTLLQLNRTRSRKGAPMLNQPTIEKLHTMKLHGMADGFRTQLETTDVSQLAFEERFALLVDQQWLWRENRALARRLRSAKLKERGVIEDIDYQHPRGLDRKLLRTLAASEWVRQNQNVLFIGPTGIGKSWLACALAQKACRDGFSILHKRITELFRELAVAHVDGSIGRVLVKLSRVDVLVLDDFAMTPLKDSERRDFLEICDDRYQRRSLILTSQVPIAHWHEQIGDPTIADSILDRLVHNAYRIELNGESMRKKRGRKSDEGAA